MFAASGAQPIDVFHESERKVSLSRFLKATLFRTPEGEFVFGDVLVGGRARQANIRPGDRIISVNAADPKSEDIRVPAHRALEVEVETKTGGRNALSFGAPSSYKPGTRKKCRVSGTGQRSWLHSNCELAWHSGDRCSTGNQRCYPRSEMQTPDRRLAGKLRIRWGWKSQAHELSHARANSRWL